MAGVGRSGVTYRICPHICLAFIREDGGGPTGGVGDGEHCLLHTRSGLRGKGPVRVLLVRAYGEWKLPESLGFSSLIISPHNHP